MAGGMIFAVADLSPNEQGAQQIVLRKHVLYIGIDL
jgi:hypothetical protein